jgi:hypothetical protein
MYSLGGIMRALKTLLAVALALGALPLTAVPQQQPKLTEVVDKIVAQEQAEMQSLRQYSPIVETYIQILRPNKDLGAVPKGDKYFLGLGEFSFDGVSPARLPPNDLPGHERVQPSALQV